MNGRVASFQGRWGLIAALMLAGCGAGNGDDRSKLQVPIDVPMNADAGRGSWLFAEIKLSDGTRVTLLVDTGSNATCLDKSLEEKLGPQLGRTTGRHFDDQLALNIYAAPAMRLGGRRLVMAERVYTSDFSGLSKDAGRPVQGILGMDCLMHYCVDLDFVNGRLRLTDRPESVRDARQYRLVISRGLPWVEHAVMFGESAGNLLIDTGNAQDGDVDAAAFQTLVQKHVLRVKAQEINGKPPKKAWGPACTWDGQTYPSVLIGSGVNGVGLRFLARHRVTLDFPQCVMYLEPAQTEPLVDTRSSVARAFLLELKTSDRLPMWPKNDPDEPELEAHPDFATYDFRVPCDAGTLHFTVRNESGACRLIHVWRTDSDDRVIQEFGNLLQNKP